MRRGLLKVFAVEVGEGEALLLIGQEVEVWVSEHSLEYALVPGLRERCERDHLAGEVVGDLGDLVQGDDLGDEADSVRLLSVDQPGRQQDVGGVSGSDKLHQTSHLLVSDEYGQPGDGYPEATVVGGDADVGGHG